MTASGPALTASGSVEVAAGADAVYAVLTDLDALAALAEETERMAWRKGPRAAPGAVFTGANRNGATTWSTTCRVTHAEPGRRFGFEVSTGPADRVLAVRRGAPRHRPVPGDGVHLGPPTGLVQGACRLADRRARPGPGQPRAHRGHPGPAAGPLRPPAAG